MTIILAFESSCDETAVALLRVNNNSSDKTTLTHLLHSQIALHALYGGVVPELASRDHVCRIRAITNDVLAKANATINDIDIIAYTAGPGLAGALMVAASFAQGLAFAWNKKVLPLHHLEGHLMSALLSENGDANACENTLKFPFVALLVSGGHSQIYAVKNAGNYSLLGESVDDAAGEAFDKAAKMMGLPYPGGQYLENMVKECPHDAPALVKPLPRPMLYSKDLMMSFSGLKTAVWQVLRKVPKGEERQQYPVIAREFQQAIVEVLVHKSIKACRETGINRLAICGGVAKNETLRQGFIEACAKESIECSFTPLEFCTDNAAMMAKSASFHINKAKPAGAFAVHPHWTLDAAIKD